MPQGTSTREINGLVEELTTDLDRDGRSAVASQLTEAIYPELRRLAQAYLNRERADHTLQATALVHEAYCRLVKPEPVGWEGKTHFFAVAAVSMRRILVDYAKARGRAKRGGGARRVTLVDHLGAATVEEGVDVLALHQALERLAGLDARQARALELRWFSGLTVREIAECLSVSKRTIEGDLAHARAWLARELAAGARP